MKFTFKSTKNNFSRLQRVAGDGRNVLIKLKKLQVGTIVAYTPFDKEKKYRITLYIKNIPTSQQPLG